MPRKTPPIDEDEQRDEFRKRMTEMNTARLEMFAANADKTAEVLGEFRKALERSGFSRDESMQIVLKYAEQTMGRRPMFPWWHWTKHSEKER